MEIKTLDDLKKNFPELMEEHRLEIESDLDSKIAEAIAEEKEKIREKVEDDVIDVYEQKREEDLDVLRGICESILHVPGVLPEEDENVEQEDQEETPEEKG